MPDYFYHIRIELFNIDQSLPVNLSQTFRALNPFTSQRARGSRDHRYDSDVSSMRHQASSFSQASVFDSVPPSTRDDSRIDQVFVEATDDITAGIGTKFASAKTKAVFTSVEESESGDRGIVHLYRDIDETPGLYRREGRISSSDFWNGDAQARRHLSTRPLGSWKDEDCTTVAILAVPSYMTPRDFLAFVGEETRNAVKHFRMIRTSRLNRYMVLMKFKDGRYARQWQNDWNTKLFNAMEPETCHVVFVKSVELIHNQELRDAGARTDQSSNFNAIHSNNRLASKPIAPPTPSLVELPTCPVCLERMDESTGLITNLCQHVFHCTCLEKWSGYGCPVCRFTDDSFGTGAIHPEKSKKHLNANGEYELTDQDIFCYECRSSESLWQCLICGLVGCGRYAGKHAYKHYEQSAHTFALDLESQRVWDYDRDCYVHRIIANGSSGNEKLVELPGRRREGQTTALEDADQDFDVAKRENLAFEYTQLLTSQLESQRMYFEDQVAKAVDTKMRALKQADRGNKDAEVVKTQLEEAVDARNALQEKLEFLEKSKAKHESKSQKLGQDYKILEKKYEELKVLSDTISENKKLRDHETTVKRNELLTDQAKEIRILKEEIATKNFFLESLQEQINDLRIQVAATKHLEEKVASGELTQEELEGATMFAGPSRYSDGTPATGTMASRLKKRGASKAKSQSPAKEPTDEDVQVSVTRTETSTALGRIAIMVKDFIHPSWRYTASATESKIIANGVETKWLVHRKNEQVAFNGSPNRKEVESFLLAEDLIELSSPPDIKRTITDPEKAEPVMQMLLESNHFKIAPGKTLSDVWQTLVEQGVTERQEEDNLYESDASGAEQHGDSAATSAKSKSKKKKSKKRKK